MKVIEPGYEIIDNIDSNEILKRLEKAGRTCYKSESKDNIETTHAFIKGIISRGHHTILEHEKVSVRVICDRGVSHEIVRHRLASYSQESTRYCNYSKEKFGEEITVVNPCFWKIDTQPYVEWVEAMEDAEDHYFNLLALGAAPQEARSVLPNSLKTEIVITMNLREWRHFFLLRAVGTTGKPHPQMKQIALPMLLDFNILIPVVFEDVVAQLKD